MYVIKRGLSGLTIDQKHSNQLALSHKIEKLKIQFKQRKKLKNKCMRLQIK